MAMLEHHPVLTLILLQSISIYLVKQAEVLGQGKMLAKRVRIIFLGIDQNIMMIGKGMRLN